ncbi:MAG: hypothetical protein ACR2ID_06915 [Chthoniobacterales bacterium]
MIKVGASKSFAETERRAAFTASATATAPAVTWLNLVCLDAPLVAIGWAWLFARSFGVPLARGGSAALFLTAWLIYLADRLGDSFSLLPAAPASLRQRFCRRHRGVWLALIGLLAAADVFVIGTQLEAPSLRTGFAVGLAALVYLLVNQLRPSLWRVLPLKELSIGLLFAAGTIVALRPGLTNAMRPTWILFAGVCACNCIGIAVWERALDLAQGRISVATAFPRIEPWVAPLLLGLAATSVAWGLAIYGCLTASAVLLALVHIFRSRLAPDVRTALADLVLLTPWLALALP